MKAARQYHSFQSFLKRPFGTLLFCSLLLLPTAFAQVDSQRALPSAREDQDYSFAFGLYSDKLYELAAEQFDTFIQRYPSSVRRPDALFLRSECAWFMKDYELALSGYLSYIRDYPKSSLADDSHFRSGHCYLALGKNDEAVERFKNVVDEFPGSGLAGESAYWLGEAYDRGGDMNNALKYFTLSYEHFENNPYKDYAMYAVGWTYQKNARYKDARDAYGALISAMPKSGLVSAARVRVGECLLGEHDYRAAIDDLSPLSADLTDSTLLADVEYAVGESYYGLGDFVAAASAYRRVIESYPAHRKYQDALYGLGWTFLKTERYDSAAGVFLFLSGMGGPRAHEALYRTGYALRESGNVDSARTVLLSVADRFPEGEFSDDALTDAADIELRAGHNASAGVLASRVVGSYPESNVLGDALWMLGELALTDQKPAEARRYLLRAGESPVSGREIKVTAAFRAATAAFRLGMYDTSASAFAAFRTAYPGHPKSVEAAYWQAESEYRRGNFSAAHDLYGTAARASSGKQKSDALYGLGWSAYKQGKLSEAVEAFGQLISGARRSEVDYDARMRQADALYAMKEFRRAEEAYRSVVRLYPDTAANDVARYQAAQCAFRRDDFPGAYAQFQDLVRLMPDSPLADDAQYAMGWISFRRKQYSDAIKDFQVVIRSFPKGDVVPRAYYSLADGYYNLGQYPAAEKSYRDVITLFPESQYVPDAITGLQYSLTAQGKDEEAVRAIDDFLKEHASSPSAQTLVLKKAEILYGKGDAAAAGAAYRDFIGTYPSSSLKGEALYWLGKSELLANRPDAAYNAFRQSWEVPGSFRGPALLEALDVGIQLGKTEEALALILGYERSMSPQEIRADVAYRKAQLFAADGNTEEAQRLFERLVADQPEEKAAYQSRIALARLALAAGETERARLLAEDVASARTDDLGAEGQYLIGRAYALVSNWKEAITAYLRVKYVYASSREWNDRAVLALAAAYRASGEKDRARQTLKDFLSGSPDPALRSEGEALLKELGG